MLLLGSDLVKQRRTPTCQPDHLIPIQIIALTVYLGKLKAKSPFYSILKLIRSLVVFFSPKSPDDIPFRTLSGNLME